MNASVLKELYLALEEWARGHKVEVTFILEMIMRKKSYRSMIRFF